jgi:hypothetical protein
VGGRAHLPPTPRRKPTRWLKPRSRAWRCRLSCLRGLRPRSPTIRWYRCGAFFNTWGGVAPPQRARIKEMGGLCRRKNSSDIDQAMVLSSVECQRYCCIRAVIMGASACQTDGDRSDGEGPESDPLHVLLNDFLMSIFRTPFRSHADKSSNFVDQFKNKYKQSNPRKDKSLSGFFFLVASLGS